MFKLIFVIFISFSALAVELDIPADTPILKQEPRTYECVPMTLFQNFYLSSNKDYNNYVNSYSPGHREGSWRGDIIKDKNLPKEVEDFYMRYLSFHYFEFSMSRQKFNGTPFDLIQSFLSEVNDEFEESTPKIKMVGIGEKNESTNYNYEQDLSKLVKSFELMISNGFPVPIFYGVNIASTHMVNVVGIDSHEIDNQDFVSLKLIDNSIDHSDGIVYRYLVFRKNENLLEGPLEAIIVESLEEMTEEYYHQKRKFQIYGFGYLTFD